MKRRKGMKRIERRVLFSLGMLMLLLPCMYGCHAQKDAAARFEDHEPDKYLNRYPEPGSDQEVDKEELEAALRRLPEHRREEFRETVLNRLLETKAFARKAREAGLDRDRKVKEELRRVTDETLARFFIKKCLDKEAQISREDLENYYQKNRDAFALPASVSVQHIVVQSGKRAEELLGALQEGASFETLAREKSICRCWKSGGKHGWLYKGRIDPDLEKAAFALKTGKLSDVIKTKDGYQIMKVLDTKNEQLVSFEEAKEGIRSRLFEKRRRELLQKYFEEAKVSFHPAEEHILARVGGEVISEEMLFPFLSNASEKEKEKLKGAWVHYLVETSVFSKKAREANLESDPEVGAEIKRRVTWTLANAFRKNMDEITVSEQDIAEFYQSHLEEFTVPVKVRTEAIIVKTHKEAEDLLKELDAGASFCDLAMKKSIHPSAARGGEIGWFGRGEKDASWEKTAFALEKGEISEVIKTDAGYGIIKLMDRKGGKVRPLDEVKQAIRMKLTMQQAEEARHRYHDKAAL
ncbi:MAG: peptidyl-prolyl cis-trans isomerase [bacterium]